MADSEDGGLLPICAQDLNSRSGETTEADSKSAPERIGRYPVVEELGRGGMGVVYLAEDPTLERRIAIKVLPSRLAGSPERWERFGQEAKLLAAVKHPRIATVYSMEEDGGIRFLTMELLEGESLAKRLARESALGLLDAMGTGEQIAVALAAAHDAGVVHRDLKPQNVQVLPDGRIKVFDFGIAASSGILRDRSAAKTRTRPGPESGSAHDATFESEPRTGQSGSSEPLAGTPGYMSPERIQAGEAGPREDLWALGCVLFECLTGIAPFRRDSLAATVRATLHEPPPWDRLPAETPESVRDLLARCLTREAASRNVTAEEAAAVLRLELSRREESLRYRRDDDGGGGEELLPSTSGRFIGRTAELSEIGRRIRGHRLVTIAGVGGGGKTRLAVEAGRELARHFEGGARYATFASVSEADLLVRTVAAAFEVDGADEDLFAEIVRTVGDQKLLLILDNCEHLLEDCRALVDRLLESCVHLRVLATSRRLLGSVRESAFALEPLPVPDTDSATLESIAHIETVRLFLDRADRVSPGFQLTDADAGNLAEVCTLLEGMPLAIELAASRMRMLSLSQIRERLADPLRMLSRGTSDDARHRSVRAAIDWSYEQLAPEEQALLRRLAVFAGGCALEAAEAVCTDEEIASDDVLDLLSELVDVSLVTADAAKADRPARYRLLETVRQYAKEKLAGEGEGDRFGERHSVYFAQLAGACEAEINGPKSARALADLDRDHDNLMAAVRRAAETETDPEAALVLARAMATFWDIRGFNETGRHALEALLAAPHLQDSDRTAVLSATATLCINQGDYARAETLCEDSLRLGRINGDRAGQARALHNLAICAYYTERLDRSRSLWEESLAIGRELGGKQGCATTLNSLGVVALEMGDDAGARAYYEESLALKRELGNRRAVAVTISNLAQIVTRTDQDAARVLLEEAIEINREVGSDGNLAFALRQLSNIDRMEGNLQQARAHLEESLGLVQRVGERLGELETLRNLCAVTREEGDLAGAVQLGQSSLRIAVELGDRHEAVTILAYIGHAVCEGGEVEVAARLLGGIQTLQESLDSRLLAGSSRQIEILRTALSNAATAAGRVGDCEAQTARGRELDYESLIAYALRLQGGSSA